MQAFRELGPVSLVNKGRGGKGEESATRGHRGAKAPSFLPSVYIEVFEEVRTVFRTWDTSVNRTMISALMELMLLWLRVVGRDTTANTTRGRS